MTPVDFRPATDRLAGLVAAVRDDQLDGPPPCPAYTLGDLLEHVGGLAVGLQATARKDTGETVAPPGDASRLPDGWRPRIAQDLDGLAAAWRDPSAWTGMTKAGGVELPGEVAGL